MLGSSLLPRLDNQVSTISHVDHHILIYEPVKKPNKIVNAKMVPWLEMTVHIASSSVPQTVSEIISILILQIK